VVGAERGQIDAGLTGHKKALFAAGQKLSELRGSSMKLASMSCF
jgi:hypothetical protein